METLKQFIDILDMDYDKLHKSSDDIDKILCESLEGYIQTNGYILKKTTKYIPHNLIFADNYANRLKNLHYLHYNTNPPSSIERFISALLEFQVSIIKFGILEDDDLNDYDKYGYILGERDIAFLLLDLSVKKNEDVIKHIILSRDSEFLETVHILISRFKRENMDKDYIITKLNEYVKSKQE